ncbi:sigma factor-like helix-turn-helix DNA-binding protein [Paenibacillus naphthalenovorans]|uniref:sigma factor-like helix-turn-helix DNA-binding protein n=1 Tax=Paenibacillus naphthalenovorans TaxID=162209 RepID=UPI003D268D1B
MGHVKTDIHEKGRTYNATYALNSADGVRALLRDRHKIAERRFRGDYDASAILIDLHSAIESAALTERQAEAIAWVYGLDVTQTEAARQMGITQQAVQQAVESAAERIAGVYSRWSYGEVSVELTKDNAEEAAV